MFDWIKRSFSKKLFERWVKELKLNINGMRKMAEDYVKAGGFKEVREVLEVQGAEALLPKEFIELTEEGRKIELAFADSCKKLADCYEKLLKIIEGLVEKL